MMQEEHLPGTRAVAWWVDRLTGGVDADHVEESGGPLGFALAIVEGGCCCERMAPAEGDTFEPYTATCLRCEAESFLRALAGERDCEVAFGVSQGSG